MPIEWRVLDNDSKSLFLLSEKSLDYIPYHSSADDVMYFRDWDNSTLRMFLNTVFLDFAFNSDERQAILTTERIENETRTLDKVFLLAEPETDLLGNGEKDKAAMLTDFGVKRAGHITGQFDDGGKFGFPWWLQSVVRGQDHAYTVGRRYGKPGGVEVAGISSEYYGSSKAVRPAIRICLSNNVKSENYVFKVHNPSRDFEKEAEGFAYYKKAKNLLMGEPSDKAAACEFFKKALECGYTAAVYAAEIVFNQRLKELECGKKEWVTLDRRSVFNDDRYGAVSWSEDDFELALWWYKNKADAGDVEAMCCIGHMYYRPLIRGDYLYYETVPKTDEEYEGTFYWWGKAAEAGMFEAQALLGEVYEGDCVKADQKKAYYWYSKAALRNDGSVGEGHRRGRIQCKLAYMCLEGRGTKKDINKALFWADKAYILNDYRKAESIYYSLAHSVALKLATKAHKGQVDKNGAPYIEHVKKVSSYCVWENVRTAALLHDIVEDTDTTFDDLRENGFSEEIVTAVDCLTKRKGEKLDDYFDRIASSDVAIEVKFADMRHNSEKKRWPEDKRQQAEENHQKYLNRAKKLAERVGIERMEEFLAEDTYVWLNGGQKTKDKI